ncbi:MAG: flagellar basal body-associated FliL family protein [Eubacteriales bacterium]
MKKNLISILILALLIVNLAVTFIMMISVTGTANATSDLISDVARIIAIELDGEMTGASSVAIEDIVLHNIEDTMTIALKTGEDGIPHFVLVKTSFSMNSQHSDYASISTAMLDKDPLIKDAIIEVFSGKSIDQATNEQAQIKLEILEKVQSLFRSDVIFDVSFVEITPQ